jgi:hypothetical protein
VTLFTATLLTVTWPVTTNEHEIRRAAKNDAMIPLETRFELTRFSFDRKDLVGRFERFLLPGSVRSGKGREAPDS